MREFVIFVVGKTREMAEKKFGFRAKDALIKVMEAYKALPKESKPRSCDRLFYMIEDSVGISRSAMMRYKKNHGWQEVLDLYFKGKMDEGDRFFDVHFEHGSVPYVEVIKPKSKRRKRGRAEVVIPAGSPKIKVVQKKIDALSMKVTVEEEHISLLTMQKQMKSVTFYSLEASKDILMISRVMIKYYYEEIQAVIAEAGGVVANLDQMGRASIKTYSDEIKYYQKQCAEFLKPSAIARYMQILGVDKLDPSLTEIMKEAFTPNAILQAVEQISASRTAFEMAQDDEAWDNKMEHYTDGQRVDIEGRH